MASMTATATASAPLALPSLHPSLTWVHGPHLVQLRWGDNWPTWERSTGDPITPDYLPHLSRIIRIEPAGRALHLALSGGEQSIYLWIDSACYASELVELPLTVVEWLCGCDRVQRSHQLLQWASDLPGATLAADDDALIVEVGGRVVSLDRFGSLLSIDSIPAEDFPFALDGCVDMCDVTVEDRALVLDLADGEVTLDYHDSIVVFEDAEGLITRFDCATGCVEAEPVAITDDLPRIGVEIETWGASRRAVRAALRAQGLSWRVVDDASIRGPSGETVGDCAEVCTPPLLPSELACAVGRCTWALERVECETTPTCGLHVHVSGAQLASDGAALARLLRAWASIEPVLARCTRPSRLRSGVAAPLVGAAHFDALLQAQSDLAALKSAWYLPEPCEVEKKYNKSRYFTLNLHRLWQKSGSDRTVEFRLFNGTLDSHTIVACALWCFNFVQAVISGGPAPSVAPLLACLE